MENLNIKLELDPIFETLALLHLSSNYDGYKEKAIAELDKFVVDSEAFYNKHLKYHDKYIRSFKKYKVSHQQESFFFENNEQLFELLLFPLCLNKQWMHSLQEVSEQKIRAQFFDVIVQFEAHKDLTLPQIEFEKLNELSYIISYLNHTSLDEVTKWKLMTILEQPYKYMNALITIVEENIPAFEKAKQDIDKQLQKLMQNLDNILKENKEPTLFDGILSEISIIYPTFVLPLGQVALGNLCYYGLQIHLLPGFKQNAQQSHELLLTRLKALSDHSKLQIIQLLKERPKYNLEIAEQLGLTAATASHHMNVLLACSLVSIDKKNGKVYYHVEHEQLRQFISELQQFLL